MNNVKLFNIFSKASCSIFSSLRKKILKNSVKFVMIECNRKIIIKFPYSFTSGLYLIIIHTIIRINTDSMLFMNETFTRYFQACSGFLLVSLKVRFPSQKSTINVKNITKLITKLYTQNSAFHRWRAIQRLIKKVNNLAKNSDTSNRKLFFATVCLNDVF